MEQYLVDTHPEQGSPRGIDSVQNGLLLQASLHVLWYSHLVSIVPVGVESLQPLTLGRDEGYVFRGGQSPQHRS
jgi:hypothetical protein